MQHSCYHVDTIGHPNSRNNQTVGTSTCGCNSNTIFSEIKIFTFPTIAPCMLICQQVSLGYACESRKMAALLNSLFFVFKISFLPKYRIKYYLVQYIQDRPSASPALTSCSQRIHKRHAKDCNNRDVRGGMTRICYAFQLP